MLNTEVAAGAGPKPKTVDGGRQESAMSWSGLSTNMNRQRSLSDSMSANDSEQITLSKFLQCLAVDKNAYVTDTDLSTPLRWGEPRGWNLPP